MRKSYVLPFGVTLTTKLRRLNDSAILHGMESQSHRTKIATIVEKKQKPTNIMSPATNITTTISLNTSTRLLLAMATLLCSSILDQVHAVDIAC
jgi:hypothetical protein